MTQITLAGTGSMLALIPHLLGFHPSPGALVVLSLRGSALGGAMCASPDLVTDPLPTKERFAASLRPLLRGGPNGAVVVYYGRVTDSATRMVARISSAIVGEGVTVHEQVAAGQESWQHFSCTCCPPEGTPMTEEDGSVQEYALRVGTTPATSREALRASLESGDRSPGVAAEIERVQGEQGGMEKGAFCWGLILNQAGPFTDVPDHAVARAALVLGSSIPFRDALLCHLCPGFLPANEDHMSAGIAVLIEDIPRPWAEAQPTEAEARALLERMIAICAALPDGNACPSLTLLGAVAWWYGFGTQARCAIERARTVDPTYRLAMLLEEALQAGLTPQA